VKCPFCSHPDTQVVETRESDEGDVIRRRRRCNAYERADLQIPAIVKKNGSRAEYAREKLRASFNLALRKRPVSAELVDAAIEHVEAKLLASGAREIDSGALGELVMQQLKKLDKVAYVRFASVYRSFDTVGDFEGVLEEVRTKKKK
jgi:transcriptional repressor NrdR